MSDATPRQQSSPQYVFVDHRIDDLRPPDQLLLREAERPLRQFMSHRARLRNRRESDLRSPSIVLEANLSRGKTEPLSKTLHKRPHDSTLVLQRPGRGNVKREQHADGHHELPISLVA